MTVRALHRRDYRSGSSEPIVDLRYLVLEMTFLQALCTRNAQISQKSEALQLTNYN